MRTIPVVLAVLLVGALAATPAASATTLDITFAPNLNLSGVLGTVTLNQNGSNIDVIITMNPGYAIVVNHGGFLAFGLQNCCLPGQTLTNTSLANFSIDNVGVTLSNHISGTGWGSGQIFHSFLNTQQLAATTVSFTILNFNVNQITGVGIRLCVLGGNGCSATGFASTGINPGAAIPEPSTMSMLGMGLLGIAGLVRRRFSS